MALEHVLFVAGAVFVATVGLTIFFDYINDYLDRFNETDVNSTT